MASSKHTAESFRLTLISYPPDQEVTVVKIIKECTGLDLYQDVVEELPAVFSFESAEALEVCRKSLEEGPGAVVSIEPYVDSEVVGEDEPARHRGDALFEAIEEQRMRLYELEALLRAAKCAVQSDAADVDTLLDLAARIVSEVNRDLDVVNLKAVAEEARS